MGTIDELLAEYDANLELHRDLASKLEGLVGELLTTNSVHVHSVRSRVKERSSLERKVQRGIEGFTALCDVPDVVALRIITYFPDEVDAIAQIVAQEFKVDDARSTDKRAALDPDRFGYLSLHYICRLSSGRLDLTEYQRFSECVFEVQIRSILQHAWAEIEHDLGYKSEAAVPRHIRRRFSQLAGMLEVADDLFVGIREELASYSADVTKQVNVELDTVLIDQVSMMVYFRSSRRVHRLDRRISASLGVKVGSLPFDGVADYARAAQAAGFVTLAEVDAWLDRYGDFISAYVHRWFNGPAPDLVGCFSLYFLFYVRAALGGDLDEVRRFLRSADPDVPEERVASHFAARILSVFDETAAEVPLPPPP